jgi:hypothetical protein
MAQNMVSINMCRKRFGNELEPLEGDPATTVGSELWLQKYRMLVILLKGTDVQSGRCE